MATQVRARRRSQFAPAAPAPTRLNYAAPNARQAARLCVLGRSDRWSRRRRRSRHWRDDKSVDRKWSGFAFDRVARRPTCAANLMLRRTLVRVCARDFHHVKCCLTFRRCAHRSPHEAQPTRPANKLLRHNVASACSTNRVRGKLAPENGADACQEVGSSVANACERWFAHLHGPTSGRAEQSAVRLGRSLTVCARLKAARRGPSRAEWRRMRRRTCPCGNKAFARASERAVGQKRQSKSLRTRAPSSSLGALAWHVREHAAAPLPRREAGA